MIVHHLFLPAKQVIIDGFYFCLMLVLVISRLKLQLNLFLIGDFIFFLLLLALFSNKSSFEKSQKSKTFRASALVEAGTSQDNGNCMSPMSPNMIPIFMNVKEMGRFPVNFRSFTNFYPDEI